MRGRKPSSFGTPSNPPRSSPMMKNALRNNSLSNRTVGGCPAGSIHKKRNKMRTNKLKLDLNLIDRSLARDAFAEFVRQAWHIVEPSTPLLWNWHMDVICEYLEAVEVSDGIT